MVLEIFAALGLAGNIVQFVDFSMKLVSKTQEVYTSAEGSTKGNEFWETHITRLKRLTEELRSCRTSHRTASTAIERDLIDLALHCQELGDELLKNLKSMKRKGGKWDSFLAALKALKKKEEVEELVDEIRVVQREMGVALLVMVTKGQSEIFAELQQIVHLNKEWEMKRIDEFQRLREDVVDLVKSLKEDTKLETTTVGNFVNNLSVWESHEDWSLFTNTMKDLPGKMAKLASESNVIASEQRILSSLYHPSMNDRYERVRRAHQETFEWIYRKNDTRSLDRPSFVEWLEKEHSIYWVMGKPGAGKSTLMKLLSSHDRTRDLLTKWAGGAKLVIAQYYFWNSGSSFQKTQEGLLQTILFNILRQCPNLIQPVCSGLDTFTSSHGDPVSRARSELDVAFRQLMKQTESRVKFCFFIDGLDEYDGNPWEIIQLINSLNESPFIKLCISSRPWNAFGEAFGQNPHWMLKLEDLTKRDIEKYVQETLAQQASFQMHPQRNELVEQIREKAQGVFLWVYLAVQSLIDSLTNGDGDKTLFKRIDELPKTLEDFFQQMLDQVGRFYKTYSARMLRMALHAEKEPLSLMTYWYLDLEQEDADYAFEMHTLPLEGHEIVANHKTMTKRIEARCKGLLEVNDSDALGRSLGLYFGYKVDFLHRTVKEFILKSQKDLLRDCQDTDASLNASLCKAYLAQIKAVPKKRYQEPGWKTVAGQNNPLDILLVRLAHYAKESEQAAGVPQTEVLNETETVLNNHSIFWQGRVTEMTFFSYCRQQRLDLYVQERIMQDPKLAEPGDRPALDRALSDLSKLDPKVVKRLLEAGANPNEQWENNTIWIRFVELACNANMSQCNAIPAVMELLLKRGAEPRKKLKDGTRACKSIKRTYPQVEKRLLQSSKFQWKTPSRRIFMS